MPPVDSRVGFVFVFILLLLMTFSFQNLFNMSEICAASDSSAAQIIYLHEIENYYEKIVPRRPSRVNKKFRFFDKIAKFKIFYAIFFDFP